ncbi:DUF4244 domain-containing protein [Corynebacterium sphenisci]|uniref:DUF4244 domain-containing protein n=1 Tax=Corynebacterium sphenisci TaxID=191493 RepID=UPI0009FFEA1E
MTAAFATPSTPARRPGAAPPPPPPPPPAARPAARLRAVLADERGMSTVEYAIGTVAAAAFGALLYTVVTGGEITQALTGIIERALSTR